MAVSRRQVLLLHSSLSPSLTVTEAAGISASNSIWSSHHSEPRSYRGDAPGRRSSLWALSRTRTAHEVGKWRKAQDSAGATCTIRQQSFLKRTEEATKTTATTTFSGNRTWHLEFNSLCPYSIPNIRRADHSWFKAIYSASVHSSEFRGAAMCLDHLKAYGKGRRQERSLSFLLRHHPTLLQEILRVSFSSAEAWCTWLVMCGDLVEKELRQLAEKYRQMSSSPFTPSIVME
ncbi:hypothetical protein TcBrA4_0068690 [Trypanosoma cruzi]|nr:hypothetical protein TcBrA4_0068690 [Trypanosoma cruzi]